MSAHSCVCPSSLHFLKDRQHLPQDICRLAVCHLNAKENVFGHQISGFWRKLWMISEPTVSSQRKLLSFVT